MPELYQYLNKLLEANSEVIITDGNMPIAKLTSLKGSEPHKQDRLPDLYPRMWVSDDFDALLPGEYWLTDQE